MVSEEKMVHLVHVVMDAVVKSGMVAYVDEEGARREAKRVALAYLTHFTSIAEDVRKRILTQKNPPMEGSPQWETLFQKYSDEENKKRGG